ncbi:DUF2812 domain-containing protein [Lysinibacillus sp. FSL K6-0232]|uniref:DUF2812 domain-containing protein n=1 Tax=unclassified Lysinibacillus TaxID=2636778 RepID=UPI0030FB1BAE
MRKFNIFFDLDKEEHWLNEMAAKGWLCTKVGSGGFYTFQQASDADHIIRIDCQQGLKKEARADYKQLYEDFGWHLLKEKSYDGSYYWIKPKDGNDELFSDSESQIAKYKRLMRYASNWIVIFFVWFMFLYPNEGIFFHIKHAYLTPGLWEKEGAAFLSAFLFETPFALMRMLPPWILLIAACFYMMAYYRYRKALKNMDTY